MSDSYDEAASLWPFLARYKKLVVSLVGTTIPLFLFLTGGAHSAAEIAGACAWWVATNLGVRQVPNAE